MQGFRRAAVHIAFVALLLRAFLPTGWMPGAPGDAPLVMCSLSAVHDTADGREVPTKPNADAPCAFAATPALAAPEAIASLAPRLQHWHHFSEIVPSASVLSSVHARPAPRAPPIPV
jgi:hypothetical protein